MGMSCSAGRLTAGAGVETFQVWTYHSPHPGEAFIGENYFLPAHDRLRKGDIVEAYSVNDTRVQFVRLAVSRSDRQKVTVKPFGKTHEEDGFEFFEAELSREIPVPKPVPVPDNPDEIRFLQLKHRGRGVYAVLNANADAVVDGISGKNAAVDLFDRITSGKLSLDGARAEVERKAA